MPDLKCFKTRTGKIYVDESRKLEFLSVGDYGKENNIKAEFLGLNKPIYGVQHKEVDLSKKWVITISTQKGCPMKCDFCDCHKFGFHGNASVDDLIYQMTEVFKKESTKETDRLNLHFARMGEPTFNRNVLEFTSDYLRHTVNQFITAKTVHPVVSTMLPQKNKGLVDFILEWCEIKNNHFNGEASIQFSINSTSDEQRSEQFNGQSLSLTDIALLCNSMPNPVKRKYTLNFAVTEETVIDAQKMMNLFDIDKFLVKITPIHKTANAQIHGYDVSSTYDSYDVYEKFEEPLLEAGFDVIVFVPSKEEDEDRITCGNALIAIGEKQ